MANQRRHNNRNKQQDRSGRGKVKGNPKVAGESVIKEFTDNVFKKHHTLEAKTQNQAKLIGHLKAGRQIVISSGSSGTGKTYVACVHAANQLMADDIEKIVLTRPPDGVGKTIGFRKGDTNEKLAGPYQSMVEPLKQALGTEQYNMFLRKGKIVLEPMEDVRGRSYNNTCVIVDEASNTDVKSMQTLVTRVGKGSQIIFCGDTAPWQKDIKVQSGLEWVISLIKKTRITSPEYLDQEDWDNLHNNIGIVEFTRDDVVRSGITKLFVKVFDEEIK